MTDDTSDTNVHRLGGISDRGSTTYHTPLSTRLAHQIVKPRNWEDFQRNCVILFRGVLNDPHAAEYGRRGQNQREIDILGRRDNNPEHWVGIQCRCTEKAPEQPEILKDCRASLNLKAELKEIIFATTAPVDRNSTDAAIAVETLLRSEGHAIKIAVFGWDELQTLIAQHDQAYAAFLSINCRILRYVASVGGCRISPCICAAVSPTRRG